MFMLKLLLLKHVFARASTDVPSIGELKRRAQVELYAKKRFIRISTFDAEVSKYRERHRNLRQFNFSFSF